LPANCTQGAEYFATDAIPGQNKYLCTATNTWTQQQTGTSTFLQTGTGAVTRTVTSKLQDVVHVKDFGAKGDGVTDDSAAFTAALASGAGEVRADHGTYVINSVITLAKGQKIYFGVGTHTVGGGSGHLDAEKQRQSGCGFTDELRGADRQEQQVRFVPRRNPRLHDRRQQE
jgi:hypothetical protein